MIPFDPIRRPRGRRGFPCRGAAAAALSLLLPALVAGCVTPGVQGIQSDIDTIQEQLFRVQKENAEMAEKSLAAAISRVPEKRSCSCATALRDAIITRPDSVPAETLRRLNLLIGQYLAP